MRQFWKILSCVIAAVMAVSLVPAGAFAASKDGTKITAEAAAREFIKSGTDVYLPETADSAEAEEFPSSFDLRAADLDGSGEKKNYITPVKNQGNFGTCWGFSAIAAAESSILSETGLSCGEWEETYGNEMDLSEHHLAWFASVPLPSGDANRQDGEGVYIPGADENPSKRMNGGGLTATATSIFSCGIGPMREQDYPYRGKEGNIMYLTPDETLSYTDGEGYMPYCYSDKDDWSIDESERFGQVAALEESFLIPASAQFEQDENTGDYKFIFNQEAVCAAKKQLMLGRPLQIGYCSDSRFTNEETWAQYSPTSPKEDPFSAANSDHQVTVVGWDDDYPRENFSADNELPPENGAWIVKNSYGAVSREFPDHDNWGDDGYFYLSYYDHTIDSFEAVDFDTANEYRSGKYYDLKYNYLPANPNTQYHLYDEPCYMANNFLEYSDMIIRTLSLQTNTPNTTTTFEVYKLNEKSETPTDGELIASETKTFELGGYHRVDLAEPLYIPADTVFSVVVTNKTADGKYELVSDRNEGELISRSVMASSFDSSYPYVYAKSVVNPGESYLGSTAGDGSVSWNDWSDVLSEGEQMGTDFLKSIGYLDLLESAEQMIDEYETALSAYRAEHPEVPSDELPEEIAALQDKCYSNAAMLDRLFNSIMNGDYDDFDLTDEQLENANDQAFYVNDNFPISVIADPVEAADYALYYDPESGFHKNSKDGEPIPPEELPDGITAEGSVVTLTSDFRFVTTNRIGLALSDGVTLNVSEDESPSIQCALSGGDDPRAFGIFSSGDVTLEIDGDLAVTAEGTENAINTALCSDGDITINGSGVLNLNGGLMCDTGALTVGGGSRVTVKNEKGYIAFSTACMTGDLTVKDGSSLEIAASDPENKDCAALIICGSANEAGRITIKNNASLKITSDGIGIMPFQADTRAVADIDSSCVFTVEGDPAVGVKLEGVSAESDAAPASYDSEKEAYVNSGGEPAKSITFYPLPSSPSVGSGGSISTSTFSTSNTAPTAAPTPDATAAPQTIEPQTTDINQSSGSGLPFADVSASDWFYDAVCSAYNSGLVNGVSGTEFGPDQNMTRGMLVTIIGRMENAQSNGASMSDVDPNEYYAPYVAWAAENGIVTGFEDGTFRPDENVTREQTAAILYRYARYKGADVSLGENADISGFTDAAEISEYALSAIHWAYGAGIISGYPDGTLAPAANVTRAEFVTMLVRLEPQNSEVDYSDLANWAYFESGGTDKAADVFFVCPTVYMGGDNMSLSDEKTKSNFLGATNMEKGIYDDDSRFFAPYYRQAGLEVYTMDDSEREKYLASAYEDIKDAFEYYYKNINDGRPIILAGFSQGGDMCIRLVRDYFADKSARDQLVACYAIGWRLTGDETKKYPQLKSAEGESDTGVIIAFTCEAPEIEDSIIIPKGTKSLAINPLNWKTDGTPADKSLDLGSCFTDYGGNIKNEEPALTGAYIDDVRGALKVTDVTPEEYPPGLDVFESGVYHLYDYQFFYRNLEKNVRTRLDAFKDDRG